MRRLRLRLLPVLAVTALACAAGSAVAADAPSGNAATTPPGSQTPVAYPTRGMTMAQVQRRYGVPKVKLPPVGKPPITRWVYPDYTVYFEYKYVIHSVMHR